MSDEEPKPKTPRPRKPAESADSAAQKPRSRRTPSKTLPPASGPLLSGRLVAMVAGATLLLDQVLKYIVVHVMRLDRVREIDLIDPWLNLRMAWNQGVNFGLFSTDVEVMRWVLIVVALAVCVWVWIWLQNTVHTKFSQISGGLLIGGALGNVIDRVTYGAVADFLNMSLPMWRNPYSFNVADIAIFAGAVGLFLQPPAKREKPVEITKPATTRRKPSGKPTTPTMADDKTRDDAGK